MRPKTGLLASNMQLFCTEMAFRILCPGPAEWNPFCEVPFVSRAGNQATIHLWGVHPKGGLLPPAAEEIAVLDF